MNLRREPTYLSTEVWRALWLLAQLQSGKADEQGLARTVTADQMADAILRETIGAKFPQLFEHQKAVQKMERELLKTLGGT